LNASYTARLLFRPFRGYEELATMGAEDTPTIAEGALRLLFVIGAVVATTASGRLAPIELVVAMVSFAYVPLAQLVAMGVALRAVSRTTPIRRAFALYLAGHGPSLATLLAIATLCLVAPSPARVLLAVVPPLALVMFAWGGLLTYACFRRGLGLTGARAGIATALHAVVLSSIIVGYYLGMGQLGPQIWR
jgi:hypothetical protein